MIRSKKKPSGKVLAKKTEELVTKPPPPPARQESSEEYEESDEDYSDRQEEVKLPAPAALQPEPIEDEVEDQEEEDMREAPQGDSPPEVMAQRIKEVVQILGDLRAKREEGVSRLSYVDQLKADIAALYGYNLGLLDMFFDLFAPKEVVEFIEASEQPRPMTIRVNTLKTRRKELGKALVQRGVGLEPLAEWSKSSLKILDSRIAIGATPEYLAGHYMLQSASSLLPVITLAPQPGDKVLDLCAAPGGKTSHLAQLMQNEGVLFANDVNPKRLVALSANLQRLGVANCVITCMDGRQYSSTARGFHKILLDAPCSGTGVISRDPSIKAMRQYKEILHQQHLQKQLLLEAIDCLEPAGGSQGGEGAASKRETGVLVYSTCSVTVEENEAVLAYALARRYIKIVDTGLSVGLPGLTKHKRQRFPPALALARRVYPHTHNLDGFFVAKILKLKNGARGAEDQKKQEKEKKSQLLQEVEEVVGKKEEKSKKLKREEKREDKKDEKKRKKQKET